MSLSLKDRKKLQGVHPKFVELLEEASNVSSNQFSILSGVRSESEQYSLYLKGIAKKGYPTPCDGKNKRSSHQKSLKDGYGYAVDLDVQDDLDRVKISEIASLIVKIGKKLGLVIRWGGTFKNRDYGHFDLMGGPGLVTGEETTKEVVKETPFVEESPEVVEEEKSKKIQYYFYPITRDSILISNKLCIGDKKDPIIEFTSDYTFEDFLNTKFEEPEEDGSTPTNWERIQQTYILSEKDKYTRAAPLIKRGTKVVLPSYAQVRSGFEESDVNSDVEVQSVISYIDKEQLDLVNDPEFDSRLRKYLETTESKGPGETLAMVSGKDQFPYTTSSRVGVWIYSSTRKKVYNFSSQIHRLSITSVMKGSSFSIDLAGIGFGNEILSEVGNSVRVFSVKSIYATESSELITISEFLEVLSSNDIVFLKLAEIDSNLKDFLEIPLNELSGKFYDLIGLIDEVTEDFDANDNNITIKVSGRDFTKVLEDDQAKFFPVALTEDLNNRLILGTGGTGEKLLKRTFYGDYLTLFSKMDNSIGSIFQWYLSLLSNLGIVEESENEVLFSSYGDRRQFRDKGKQELQSGIYQIIKVIIDKGVVDRRVVDSNVASPEGSFVQLFDNLCVSPFVEWFIETYGDMVNLIVRQPPFTKGLLKAYLDRTTPSTHRIIKDLFLLSTELGFSSEIYSWYKLVPTGSFWGVTNQTSMDFLPVIQLDEYVNRWGSKPFELTTNYVKVDTSIDSKTIGRFTDMHKKSIEDLMTMIETTCYLPFTREGKIILSTVDRSFRKGTFCYLEKTGEIFYINSVSHTVVTTGSSIESVTVLGVSRGMVQRFIDGVEIEGKIYSYFSIVDFELIKSTLYTNYNLKTTENLKKGDKFVDKDIFNFFLKKKQYRQVTRNINF